MTHYDVGETFERLATFKPGGVLTDPATVTGKVRDPLTGLIATYTYPSANLVRDSLGVYRLIGVGTAPGRWYYRIVGTGAAVSVEEDYFIVDPSMFDLLEELDARALTTIEDAELYLDRVGLQGSKASEADQLRFLASLINGKSTAMLAHMRRQFKPTEDAVTKRFRYGGGGRLWFAPYELRSLTAITLHTDQPVGAQQLLLAQSDSRESDYRLEPRQKTTVGTYLRASLPLLAVNPRHGAEVSITGNWGAGSVPAGLKMVCEAEVAAEWERSTGKGTPDPVTGELSRSLAPLDFSRNSLKAMGRYRVARRRTRTLEVHS